MHFQRVIPFRHSIRFPCRIPERDNGTNSDDKCNAFFTSCTKCIFGYTPIHAVPNPSA